MPNRWGDIASDPFLLAFRRIRSRIIREWFD